MLEQPWIFNIRFKRLSKSRFLGHLYYRPLPTLSSVTLYVCYNSSMDKFYGSFCSILGFFNKDEIYSKNLLIIFKVFPNILTMSFKSCFRVLMLCLDNKEAPPRYFNSVIFIIINIPKRTVHELGIRDTL